MINLYICDEMLNERSVSYFVFHYFVGRKDSFFQEEIEIPTI